MTMPSTRVHDFTLYRAPGEGEPDDARLLETGIRGQIQDLVLGGIEYLHNESEVGNAVYRYWSRRFQLPDVTFILHQASEHPESLGPADIHLDTQRAHTLPDGSIRSQRVALFGRFMNPANQTLNISTDSVRNLTFIPHKVIMGGDANLQNIAIDSAMLYASTLEQELRTRLNGTGESIDWFAAIRAAQGLGG